MPGIQISKAIRNKLPKEEKEGIKERLREKSRGKCWLCDYDFNEATDTIVADHEEPEAEGGETELDNLNLVHSECNSIKKNYPSLTLRPYLRLTRFIRDRDEPVYYHDCLKFLDIKPKRVRIEDEGDEIRVHLPNEEIVIAPVFQEEPKEADGSLRFAFVELPKNAVFNDVECQPRSIKSKQLRAIYFDLVKNPLHEQPAVRVKGGGDTRQLVLFDGQHKALAKWIGGSETVVTKVYLDLSQEQANYLVGSVQSRVKKLPLTPFELALKMSDEYEEMFEKYLEQEEDGRESEERFIDSLPASERTRGKEEVKSALIQLVLLHDDPELKMKKRIDAKHLGVKETAFINKVLKNLIQFGPLTAEGQAGREQRNHESRNVVRVLNEFEEACLAPGSEEAASVHDKDRTQRILKQPALDVCSVLIAQLVGHVTDNDPEDAFLQDYLTSDQMKKIREGIDRIATHPIWTVELESTEKTRRVQDTLSKNQRGRQSFKDVNLKLPYVLGVDPIEDDWKD